MPGMQTRNGKAFEYAMLDALYGVCVENQEVVREGSPSLNVARECFENQSQPEKDRMRLAADCAARLFIRMEPQLVNPLNNRPLVLKIQEDRRGQAGDVRDIITLRTNNDWEIGISCKHNHYATKHSRLSPTIDFGDEWLGHSCSNDYFTEIHPYFEEMRVLKNNHVKWRDVNAKADRFYVPVLTAFINELTRITNEHEDAASNLVKYLIGRNDFYKVISDERRQTTTIQGFNFNGTLNRAAGGIQPQIRVHNLVLPTRAYRISMKPNSNTTVIVECDNSWSFAMRIHNAETYEEESLKFDVRLSGAPTHLYATEDLWAER